jgi:hypothetical protein
VDFLAVQRAVAAEGGHPPDLAELLDGAADFVDGVGDAVLAVHLHGALVQVVRLGQDGRARMAFDEQMVDAQIGQENRAGKAAASAADDQNGGVDGGGHGDSSQSGVRWVGLRRSITHR